MLPAIFLCYTIGVCHQRLVLLMQRADQCVVFGHYVALCYASYNKQTGAFIAPVLFYLGNQSKPPLITLNLNLSYPLGVHT